MSVCMQTWRFVLFTKNGCDVVVVTNLLQITVVPRVCCFLFS